MMLWATIGFDGQVTDDRLIAVFSQEFRLQPDEVMVAYSDGSRASGGADDGQDVPIFLMVTVDDPPGFEFVVDVLAGKEVPPLDESVPVLEAIVDAIGVRAIALLEWEPEYYLLRPGKRALVVEMDARALDRGEWVLTPESAAKVEAT